MGSRIARLTEDTDGVTSAVRLSATVVEMKPRTRFGLVSCES